MAPGGVGAGVFPGLSRRLHPAVPGRADSSSKALPVPWRSPCAAAHRTAPTRRRGRCSPLTDQPRHQNTGRAGLRCLEAPLGCCLPSHQLLQQQISPGCVVLSSWGSPRPTPHADTPQKKGLVFLAGAEGWLGRQGGRTGVSATLCLVSAAGDMQPGRPSSPSSSQAAKSRGEPPAASLFPTTCCC